MTARADDKGLYKRGRRWWLRLYVPGEGKTRFPLIPKGDRYATTDKNVARAIARQIRKGVLDGGNGSTSLSRDADDLEALIDRFKAINAIGITPKQARDNASRVRAFASQQGIADVLQITVSAVEDYVANLFMEGRRPKTVRNHLTSISRFCRFLVERGHLDRNPCRAVKTPRPEKLPPRFLSDAERRRAMKLAREHGIFAEVATALYTGLRREELRQLAREDVDFKGRIVIVPRSKSRRPRQVPMSVKAEKVLRQQLEATGGSRYVFPGRESAGYTGMRRKSWWTNALRPLQEAMPIFFELAGTRVGRGWHLFRHTFASRLVQRGVPIAKISAWLGHADISTTMVYAHLAPGHDEDIEKA
jgi:integrase/recombinase XerD